MTQQIVPEMAFLPLMKADKGEITIIPLPSSSFSLPPPPTPISCITTNTIVNPTTTNLNQKIQSFSPLYSPKSIQPHKKPTIHSLALTFSISFLISKSIFASLPVSFIMPIFCSIRHQCRFWLPVAATRSNFSTHPRNFLSPPPSNPTALGFTRTSGFKWNHRSEFISLYFDF